MTLLVIPLSTPPSPDSAAARNAVHRTTTLVLTPAIAIVRGSRPIARTEAPNGVWSIRIHMMIETPIAAAKSTSTIEVICSPNTRKTLIGAGREAVGVGADGELSEAEQRDPRADARDEGAEEAAAAAAASQRSEAHQVNSDPDSPRGQRSKDRAEPDRVTKVFVDVKGGDRSPGRIRALCHVQDAQMREDQAEAQGEDHDNRALAQAVGRLLPEELHRSVS
jgi:hypothetical protein